MSPVFMSPVNFTIVHATKVKTYKMKPCNPFNLNSLNYLYYSNTLHSYGYSIIFEYLKTFIFYHKDSHTLKDLVGHSKINGC